MIEYFSLTTNPPPLNVQLLVRNSKAVFTNGAKVVTFNPEQSSDVQWHVDYLAGDKYDQWAFVNPEDEYEYEQRLTAWCG